MNKKYTVCRGRGSTGTSKARTNGTGTREADCVGVRVRRVGPSVLRGSREVTGALRDLVQGATEGRPQGSAPDAADDADPLGPTFGNVK